MQLHQLNVRKTEQPKTRIGRGGKRGTTSGRGTKGQRSRSGHRIRPALRDLIIRIPKRRGFRNKAVAPKPQTIDLRVLAEGLKGRSAGKPVVVDAVVLKQAGLLPMSYRGIVKILGKGPFPFAVRVSKGIKISAGAKAAIEAAGGTID